MNAEPFLEVLASREEPSMVSMWTVYLCVSEGKIRRYTLFEGGYEVLAERSEYFNEETEDYDLPTEIDGKGVVGIDDDFVVGGELSWVNDYQKVDFDTLDDPKVREWMLENRWNPEEWWGAIQAAVARH